MTPSPQLTDHEVLSAHDFPGSNPPANSDAGTRDSVRIATRANRLIVGGMLLSLLLTASGPVVAQAIADPVVSAQVEHPSRTPVADLFNGSYVDSTDDPQTGVGAHQPGSVDMAIGEEFNIIVTIGYPEGTTDNTFFINQASPVTQITALDRTVLEILSAEVIHVGSNLSGDGVPPLGNLTVRDLNPMDSDGSQFQFGSQASDITATVDGVTDDRDRVIIRIRARMDDEDSSGGPADALPDVANVDGEPASDRNQITWNAGIDVQNRNSFATVDVVEPAVSLDKAALVGAGLLVGDAARFELLISNSGTAPAYNLVVTDTLPSSGPDIFLAFASFDAANSSCDDISGFQLDAAAPPAIVFSFDQLNAGSTCNLIFDTTVQASIALNESYTNSATVNAFDSRDDATDSDNRSYSGGSDTADITTGIPDLQLTKSGGGASLLPGDTFAYTLDYLNGGTRTAVGVVITETVPANTTFDDGNSSPGWSCADGSPGGTLCTLSVGSLAPSGSGQALFAVQVDDPLPVAVTSIVNLASIDDDGTNGADPNPDNNSARDSTPVVNTGRLTVAKSASPAEGTDFAFSSTVPGDTFSGQGSFNVAFAGTLSGLAIDSSGNICVLDRIGSVGCFDSSGVSTGISFPTGFGTSNSGIALDGADNFYVADFDGTVVQFDSVGIPTGITFDVSPISEVQGLAVDASGNLFVINQAGDVAQFDSRGEATGFTFNAGLPDTGSGLSIDGVGNIWAVSVDGTILELDSQGVPTGLSFTAGLADREAAIGVRGSGEVFVVDETGEVGIFSRDPVSFSLDDEVTQNDGIDSSITFEDLPVGTYSFTEILPINWDLEDATCVGGADPGSLAGTTLSVALAAGETITCTVLNDQRRVDIQLGQTESVDPVIAGSGSGNLSYLITATNAGPSDASGLEISEVLTLPAGVTVDSITPSVGTFTSPTWNVGTLASGSSATLSVLLTVDATAATGTDLITSAATVAAVQEVETDPANDSASLSTSIERQVDIQLGQTESVDPVIAGSGSGNLSYVITATNAGPSDASGLEISEVLTLPAGVTVDTITPSVGTFTAPTWNVGTLASGSSATLSVLLTADATAATGTDLITSAATVAAVQEVETDPANNSASLSTSIERQVDIQLGQTESVDPVIAGSGSGNLSYVITATNAGPSDASGLEISEVLTLPAGVSVDSITPSVGTFTSPTWNVGTLASGSSATLSVLLTVDATAAVGTNVIASAATLAAVQEVETDPANNSASLSTSIMFSSLFDFGDAPDPTYATLLASDGARHGQPSTLFLGASVDAEPDGQPSGDASGDDITGNPDDEDGFSVLPLLAPGTTPTLEVTASASGILSAWMDFDQDGVWAASEQVLTDVTVNAGVNSLVISIPADAIIGTTIARFRLASASGLSVGGAAADGEVEDHQAEIQVSLDDSDGDGVMDDVEDASPEGGDGNGDGLLDKYQASVTSLPSASTGSFLTLEATESGCYLGNVEAVDPAGLPEDIGSISYMPIQGVVGFELSCAQATVTVIYHFEEPPISSAYRLFGPTPERPEARWYSLDATVATREIDGFPSATATFELRDGERGDHDLTADGTIVTLGALASGVSTPTVIPTLSTVGLLALGLLMALCGGFMIRRRAM